MANSPSNSVGINATEPDQQSYQRNGLIIAVIAALLFSSKPILIKYLYQLGIEPLPLMWIRMLMALPLYLVVGIYAWQKAPHKPTAAAIAQAAAIGLLGYYLASYLDLQGLQYISAQFERVILYAYPSFVVILGVLFFNQSLKLSLILPLLLTYAGLLVMYSSDLSVAAISSELHQRGALLILASALSFAAYILFSKNSIATLGSLLFTSVAMTSAALATSLHQWLAAGVEIQSYSSEIWFNLILLTLFATVLPSFMTSEAIKRIGPQKASMTGTLGPVATSAMAILFLGESFSLSAMAGMALVIAGIARLGK